jgi:hypothetical protein
MRVCVCISLSNSFVAFYKDSYFSETLKRKCVFGQRKNSWTYEHFGVLGQRAYIYIYKDTKAFDDDDDDDALR